MWTTVRSMIDAGLEGQASRLMSLAQAYKDRTVAEAKQQAAAAGVTAALVVVGSLFAVMAAGIGFAALYYAVAVVHGPMAGFAAAGGAALLVALLLFTIVAVRTNRTSSSSAELHAIKREAKDALRRTERAASTLGARAQTDALALGKQGVDAATGIVREGSREAVLATLAATVVIGMLLGRRR